MKKKEMLLIKIAAWLVAAALTVGIFSVFREEMLMLGSEIVVFAIRSYLPAKGMFSDEKEMTVNVTAEATSETKKETTTRKETTKPTEALKTLSLTDIDSDIQKLISERKKTADKDKKDGDIKEYKYINDGVTDKYGLVRVKNVNKTQINIEEKLKEKIDLSVTKDKPAVLIFHTHTTETFMQKDAEYYTADDKARTTDNNKNMAKIGSIIAKKLNDNGIKTIHDTTKHDYPEYTGSYTRAAKTITSYLKKYPSIKIVLDLHRDSVSADGGKAKLVTQINGKNAAQVMLVMGSQTGGITGFPNWKENLSLAFKLQQTIEAKYPTLARPLMLASKKYNESLSKGSLLIEFGTEANTLSEATYSAELVGNSLVSLLNTLK